MSFRPELPPKRGYIEVVDSEGVHVYEKTPELLRQEQEQIENEILRTENVNLQAENKLLKAQVQAQSERADFVEDCLAEMASLVYV